MSLSDAVGPDAPDPYELLSWYAEMGVTEALDETPRNHFADPVPAGGNGQPRLRAHRRKLFGLTIDPERLQQIRQERRPNSTYAKPETCRREVAAAEAMFQMERIPTLSTTHTSIEEIASKVMSTLGLQREMF